MSQVQPGLITYCTNIHPGESWSEVFAALDTHIPVVKQSVSPQAPFPLGLRLSSRAAAELTPAAIATFKNWLKDKDCFVPTVNGFPYGEFHGSVIKEKVYLPDWRSDERRDYTIRVADILAELMPADISGSISTVPLGFKGAVSRHDLPLLRQQLAAVLAHLAGILDERGRNIVLALEPEPGCLLETTEDVCRFFDTVNLPHRLRHHLGICYDCSHQAVEFEEPAASLAMLAASEVPVAKVQISSALRFNGDDPGMLTPFAEPGYLHQVVIRRRDGRLVRYNDLPDALSGHCRQAGDEWRCHFHLPVFHEGSGAIGTTREFITQLLPRLQQETLLEVETYTWDVLPPELRSGTVTASIVREINWLEEQLNAAHRCP